jgi:unsaturated chondroitin disaccharide hydrolase
MGIADGGDNDGDASDHFGLPGLATLFHARDRNDRVERLSVNDALEFSIARTRANLARLTDFPERTENGEWICHRDGWWVGGFWVGLLWRAFARTRAIEFERAARTFATRVSPRATDATTHDLGFLFYLSHVLGAQITGDATLHAPALTAARTLAERFNPRGKFIQAWGARDVNDERRGRAIIDTMMNLALLFWASETTGDPRYAEIATAHARTALAYQVRPDWSTAHVADFDPATGAFLKQDTHQGLSATSCWSRGQAWAVSGFTECYRATRDEIFLNAARQLADYALRRLPADGVPFWDYDSPAIPHDLRDSSAGAILASGLLQLAQIEADARHRARWHDAARAILESLWQNYSSRDTNEPSMLIHGTRSKPHGLMNHGLIYGDYYFVEALSLEAGW